MRQHAWLNAVPERAKNDKLDAPRLSRLEQLKVGDSDFEPEMPEALAEYLVVHLFSVGPAMTTGGYSSPVTHQELEAWQRLNGTQLQPWESRFVVSLSREYVSQLYRAEKRDCLEPVREELGRGGVAPLLVARNLKRMVEEMAKL